MRLNITLLAILFVIISGALGQEQSGEGDLTVVISGFDNDEGVVLARPAGKMQNFCLIPQKIHCI